MVSRAVATHFRAGMIAPLWLLIAAIFLSEAAFGQSAPYPISDVVTSIHFDFSTHRRLAPGSDNWPVTWADDGHQYSAWGDGGGFGGTNSAGRVSNGFARVEGDRGGYVGRNVAGGYQAPHPAPFSGKCYGILAIDGALYAWRTGERSGRTAYALQELWKSIGGGASWKRTKVRFTRAGFHGKSFFAPTFLQCGKGHRDAIDGYVYTYAPDVRDADAWEVHKPGTLTLMRVGRGEVESPSRYRFFAGLDGAGKARWTSDVEAREAAFEDAANGVMCVSATYQASLRRILLIVEHTRFADGNIGIYESPTPWGPWRTVHFDTAFGQGQVEDSTFFWNFAPKWWSDDGREFVLIFTGTGSNDSWNSVQGRLSCADRIRVHP